MGLSIVPFEFADTAVTSDTRGMYAGLIIIIALSQIKKSLASNQFKLFTQTNENANINVVKLDNRNIIL